MSKRNGTANGHSGLAIIPSGRIESSILLIRGQRVLLDSDLAAIYGVTTKRLNQQVKRNIGRFPADFMFRLTKEEYGEAVTVCDHLSRSGSRSKSQIATLNLRSQIVTSSGHGGVRYTPYAFTEHGAIMAASVLNSEQAVKVSLYVVRAFVKLREMLASHSELAKKLGELERHLGKHDRQIIALVEAIRQLMAPPPEQRRKPTGFAAEAEGKQVGKEKQS
jgi:hypothetical protein